MSNLHHGDFLWSLSQDSSYPYGGVLNTLLTTNTACVPETFAVMTGTSLFYTKCREYTFTSKKKQKKNKKKNYSSILAELITIATAPVIISQTSLLQGTKNSSTNEKIHLASVFVFSFLSPVNLSFDPLLAAQVVEMLNWLAASSWITPWESFFFLFLIPTSKF